MKLTDEVSTFRSVEGIHFDEIWEQTLRSLNPLDEKSYTPPDPIDESVRAGLVAAPRGRYVLIECDFHRFGGTMGVAAGETVVRAYGRARELGLPVAQIISSGGARLQEGFFALMQMGRTVSAICRHQSAGLRTAVAFRSPTTGGVFASWGSTADIRAATPGAVIGFGGPRVVQVVTGALPLPGTNTSESGFDDGVIDALVPIDEQQDWLEQALGLRQAPPPPASQAKRGSPLLTDDSWEALLAVRDAEYPSGMDWASWLFDEWVELRGGTGRIRSAVARMGGREFVAVAMDRSRTPDQLPMPADFRLARRAIDMARRLRLPVVTLIDTPGADPGRESEREGLAREIAGTLLSMSRLDTPSVALCVGEGGSGGAMSLAHADTLFMLESTVFTVIGPEAGAAVLYRDVNRAAELARSMRISANELLQLGVIDGVLPHSPTVVRDVILASLGPSRLGSRAGRMDSATRSALGQ